MVKPTPDNVKEVLSQLSAPQQVVLRSYIASLKEEIKECETKLKQAQDGDPHAHYHGHEKCTADHSHANEHHESDQHDHSADHSHAHEHHGKEESASGDEHSHDHHEHGHHDHDKHDHHDHDHHKEEHHHGHKHGHDHHKEEDDEIPAWKKKALQDTAAASDPMAAPFGGSWTTEASVSARDDNKMEE